MTANDWHELYYKLNDACRETNNDSRADWYSLMAAKNIAHSNYMKLKYPNLSARNERRKQLELTA